MRKNYFLTNVFAACLLACLGLQAQQKHVLPLDEHDVTLLNGSQAHDHSRCGTMQRFEQMKSAYPGWEAQLREIAGKAAESSLAKGGITNVTIPVVVHVLHNNSGGALGGNNISEEQIMSQIDRLNADYAGLNDDLGDVPAAFQGVVANGTGIQFCLASVDPDGNPTNGITRTYTSTVEFFDDDGMKDAASGGVDAWPRCEYLNFWVVPELYVGSPFGSFPILGYAQLPGGPADSDGVVIPHNYFGDNTGTSVPAMAGPYYKGRTATHEVGHYLGLLHNFSDFGSCADGYGDLVDDTPPQMNPASGCPSFPVLGDPCTPAAPGIMFMNYMDYSDDECLLMFTNGQRNRIQMFMGVDPSRTCLLDAAATNCAAGPIAAGFTPENAEVCEGGTVNFVNTSVSATSYQWTFEGGTPATSTDANPSVSYDVAPGVYFVTLDVSNVDGETAQATGTVTVTECTAEPCTDFVQGAFPLGGPFTDLNPVPCGDACGAVISDFEVYINEGYLFSDLVEGSTYNVNICSGPNAGSWSSVLTLAHYNETTGAVGAVVTFATGCSLDFTVPENGSYVLVITEEGNCDGAAPTQIDNGYIEIACTGDNACVLGDFCENAIPIDASLGAVNGPYTNTGATTSASDPDAGDCYFGSDPYQATVWFTFEGDGSTIFIYTDTECPGIDTAHPDTQMGIYQDDCADPVFVACDDDSGLTFLLSGLELATEAGVTYYIAIDGWQAQGGDFCINIGEGLECSIGETEALPEQAVAGSGTESNPYIICPGNTVGLTSAGDYVIDASLDYPNPGVAWMVYSDQPGATNPLGDVNGTGIILSDAGGEVIFDSGSANLTDIGLDPGLYVLVPVIINDITSPIGAESFGACTGIDLDVEYPYFQLVLEADCPAVVGPTPEISGETKFCEGETTVLDAGEYAAYLWSPGGETTQTIELSEVGEYCVTVTDDAGATGSVCATVVANPAPTPAISGPTETCSGMGITLDAGGGYDNYAWDSGQTTQTITDTPTVNSTYCVTVADANGCTGEVCHTVTISPDIEFEIVGPSSTNSGTVITVDAGSEYEFYEWDNGETTQTLTDTPTVGQTYCVTVTDANGCTGEDCHDVAINPDIFFEIIGPSSICPGWGITLDAGVFTSYEWDTGETTQTLTTNPIIEDVTYCVTVTDATGSTGEDCHTVTVNPNPEPTIAGNLNIPAGGSTTLDAGVYEEYIWDIGTTGQTITVGEPGEYCVTVTDANGCTGSACVTVTETEGPVPSITGNLEFCEGETTVLDAGEYAAYLWSPGGETTQTIELSEVGEYCVTVTDDAGATGSVCATVVANPTPTSEIVGPAETCSGMQITLDAGGGYEDYSWDSGQTTQTITDSPTAGATYCVTVTDANGCTGWDCHDVAISPDIIFEVQGSTETCPGVAVTLDAGVFASYLWDTGETTQTITDSPTVDGTYCVTVTDASGCTGDYCHTVTVNPNPEPTITGNLNIPAGGSTTLDAGGGYVSYSWDIGTTGQTLPIDEPGEYCVTVTDANGCTGSACATVTETANNPPVADNDDYSFTASGGSFSLEVIDNDSDPDGDELTVTNVTQPAEGGTVSIDGNTLVVEVEANFVGDIVFSYEISDGTASDEATVTVTILPDCGSDAGTMPTDEVMVCAGQSSNISGNGDELVASDDVAAYVLHDASGTTLGNVMAINAGAGEFGSGDATYNQTYYVSLVVGPADGDGTLLLDHPCTVVAAGTPVVFLAPIEIAADDDCDNATGDFTVTFSVSGGLPSYEPTAQYTIGGDFGGTAFAGESLVIGPFSGGTSFGLSATDGLCGSAEVSAENVECLKTPIELLSFAGEVFEEGNFLKWVTATEIDNDYFTLERSYDGVHFETIATVAGAGTSFSQKSYNWMDVDAKAGISYYRLWQTDFGGATTELGLLNLVRGELEFEIESLKPVPVRDMLQMTYTSESHSKVTATIYDLTGKKVMQLANVAERGLNTLDIDVARFSPGVYFMTLTDGLNMQTRKWVKE